MGGALLMRGAASLTGVHPQWGGSHLINGGCVVNEDICIMPGCIINEGLCYD